MLGRPTARVGEAAGAGEVGSLARLRIDVRLGAEPTAATRPEPTNPATIMYGVVYNAESCSNVACPGRGAASAYEAAMTAGPARPEMVTLNRFAPRPAAGNAARPPISSAPPSMSSAPGM